MSRHIIRATLLATMLVLAHSSLRGQTIDENLRILEPLLGTWVGQLGAPDGSASWKTVHEYRLLWDGSAVRFTGSTPEIDSHSEGFFYWDRGEKKIEVLILSNRGVHSRGTFTREGDVVTITGRISFPERTFDFRNTIEISGDRMTDRWFQNAFGDWRPGHVVEFVRK